jgi:hypothetical protein
VQDRDSLFQHTFPVQDTKKQSGAFHCTTVAAARATPSIKIPKLLRTAQRAKNREFHIKP